jgi:hypothetical protein
MASAIRTFFPRCSAWLAGRPGRLLVLLLAASFSLPRLFGPGLVQGLDAAWQQSLQAAATGSVVFGRDFLFTYGPLGYLFTRSPVNKLILVLYDFFILASLLSVYRRLLPSPARPGGAILVLAVALITKYALSGDPEAVLFVVGGYWLWRLHAGDSFGIPLAGALAAAVLLFFSKVNFGLLMLGLIPGYSIGLLACRRDWRRAVLLTGGFALLVWIGSACWRVQLGGYLRGSLELAGGYNEAMFIPFPAHSRFPLVFVTAALLAAGIVASAFASLRAAVWRDWMMICPFVMLTAFLLLENAFVRADTVHTSRFFPSLALALAVWSLAFPGSRSVKVLLVLSLLGVGFERAALHSAEAPSQTPSPGAPAALPDSGTPLPNPSQASQPPAGHRSIPEWLTPLGYARGFWAAPWRQNAEQLGAELRARAPEVLAPGDARTAIGRSSVDVMPWDSSLAIRSGLNLKQRPVIQSYSAYTRWLDERNARFLASDNASDFILYMALSPNSIDDRPAAWDESITKRALMENYIPYMRFQQTRRFSPTGEPHPVIGLVVLKRSPGAREYEPISTNSVALALDQPLDIPASTNFVFLWLDVERTPLGKLAALSCQTSGLAAEMEYSDGTTQQYRAVLPILSTGVLINYRVESAEEILRWLSSDMTGNATARSIRFQSASPWAFRVPFQGKVVTYRLVDRHLAGPAGAGEGSGPAGPPKRSSGL